MYGNKRRLRWVHWSCPPKSLSFGLSLVSLTMHAGTSTTHGSAGSERGVARCKSRKGSRKRSQNFKTGTGHGGRLAAIIHSSAASRGNAFSVLSLTLCHKSLKPEESGTSVVAPHGRPPGPEPGFRALEVLQGKRGG